MARLNAIYASALFELFTEVLKSLPDQHARKDFEEKYATQVVFLRDALSDDECRRVLVHPHITSMEKQSFFNNILSGNIHTDLLGFLNLAISKNRESFIIPALTGLVEKLDEYQRKTTAKVISAEPLEDSQVEMLRGMLARKLNKQVELEMSVDTTVIGGLNIYVDGYFIDRTIKQKLREMKDSVKLGTAIALQAMTKTAAQQ